MPKTEELSQIRVYFSKDEYLEWNQAKDLEWENENSVSFFNGMGDEITINAPTRVIVVTRREVEVH